MTIRKLDAGRGAGWITDGLAVIKANPGPYLLGCLLVGLISSLPLIGIFFGLLMPVLYGGLVSMLHRQTRGETVAMGQAFDGFQAPGAFMRLLPIVLFNLAFAILLVLVLAVTLGAAVYQLIKTGQAGGQPDPKMVLALLPKFALVFLIMLPFCMFVSWMLMLAIPRAMLGNVPGVTALKDAAAAVLANLLPLIVNLLCLMLVMFIIILIMMIPLMLLGALQQHSMVLGMLIQIPVMAVFTGGILALYCAIMFQAWREVFADDAIAPPVPTDTFEA